MAIHTLDPADTARVSEAGGLEERVRRLEDELRKRDDLAATTPKKMAIIATKGTLDWAYPPLILAGTAASLGWEVGIFFTFYGLNILHKTKSKSIGIVPVGNPAMPMP